YFIRYTSSKTVSDMHIKMHISCRNRKQYEQRNCKTIHTQSIHRKGTVPISPTDQSTGSLGTTFIGYIDLSFSLIDIKSPSFWIIVYTIRVNTIQRFIDISLCLYST
ncbi:MAG: hypothetical protein PUE44_06850, partial [Bulleidia sp.]|nr:hypothetical protein [Bulleidia sp.]